MSLLLPNPNTNVFWPFGNLNFATGFHPIGSHNYHLPYFTLTPTFSVCPIHGYLNGEHEYCPKCDADIAEAEARTASPVSVSDDVSIEVSDAEVAEAEGLNPKKLEKVMAVVAPSIRVEGDTITVVEPANSELNFGGDTNGED